MMNDLATTPRRGARPRRAPRLAALVALAGAALAACSSKASPPPPTAGASPPAESAGARAAPSALPPVEPGAFRVATFNAGLAVGYLPYAEQRAAPVIDALARAPVDLLCVQEVWLEEHWQALRAASAARFPYAYRLPPAGDARAAGACPRAELDPLAACAREHCGGLSATGLGGCVLQHCAERAQGLSPDCLNCLLRNPVGSLDAITAACAAPAPPAAPPVPSAAPAAPGRSAPRPRSGAEVVAYGGSFGTAILSREPLADLDALVFDATLNPRAALYARVRPAALGDVHVVCTHLTPALASPLGGRPPAAEQREQIERLVPWVERKAGGGGRAVLAGDFNAGPRAGAAIEAVLPEHYARLLAAGFRNPYAGRPDARCTFCAENPLSGGAGARGALLDHVLLRGHAGGAAAEPFLRDTLELEVGGRRVRSAYSDHYGLLVTLRPPEG